MPRYIFGSGHSLFRRVENIHGNGNGQLPAAATVNHNNVQLSTGAQPYSLPYRTANVNGASYVTGNSVTPNEEVHLPSLYPHSLHRQNYLPRHREEHLVVSSVHWKWRTNQGKSLDKGLMMAVKDEMERKKMGVTKKKRSIDLELLAVLIWSLLGFVYFSRFLKTRAEALVKCVFHALFNAYPECSRMSL
jgi:hypothetical protein